MVADPGGHERGVGPLALLRVLERGPYGLLYRARDARSGQVVSVRVPPPSWPPESSMLAATRAKSLEHPHIAAVLEAGGRDGPAYVVLGEELGARVNPVALTPREAVVIVRDVATAVDYAAHRGVAHPGLVPDLLRFTPEGRVVVTGYELPGDAIGSDLYIAPEVRKGAAVDAAANVYSLGVILLVLVAGGQPDVPEDLQTRIREAMDVDPLRRPSAAALAEALTRWLEPEPVPVPPAPERPAWNEALLVTGLLALLLLGLAWPIWDGKAARASEEKASIQAPEAPPPEPRVVEAPVEPPPPVPVEEVEAPPPEPPPARVGTVTYVHPRYGIFVALEAVPTVGVGDALEAVREGSVVAVLKVRKLSRPEKLYPHGAAVCDASDPAVEPGQIVRRPKP